MVVKVLWVSTLITALISSWWLSSAMHRLSCEIQAARVDADRHEQRLTSIQTNATKAAEELTVLGEDTRKSIDKLSTELASLATKVDSFRSLQGLLNKPRK